MKWIEERTYMECPNCHNIWHYEENQTERFQFCPTCGAEMQEEGYKDCFQPSNNEKPHLSQQDHNEEIAKAFQFGVAFGFGKRYNEMDKIINEIKKITPQPKAGCEGCIYEKTGNNSTYPCSHCGRCYTDKYKAESEG